MVFHAVVHNLPECSSVKGIVCVRNLSVSIHCGHEYTEFVFLNQTARTFVHVLYIATKMLMCFLLAVVTIFRHPSCVQLCLLVCKCIVVHPPQFTYLTC